MLSKGPENNKPKSMISEPSKLATLESLHKMPIKRHRDAVVKLKRTRTKRKE